MSVPFLDLDNGEQNQVVQLVSSTLRAAAGMAPRKGTVQHEYVGPYSVKVRAYNNEGDDAFSHLSVFVEIL